MGSSPKLVWDNGRLVVEIEMTVRVPILLEAIVTTEVGQGLHLTRREQAVLMAVKKGKCNKEIATLLGISERTAKFHVGSLLRKFRVPGRADLAALFLSSLEGT